MEEKCLKREGEKKKSEEKDRDEWDKESWRMDKDVEIRREERRGWRRRKRGKKMEVKNTTKSK